VGGLELSELREGTVLPDLRDTRGEGRGKGAMGEAFWAMCAAAGRRTRIDSAGSPEATVGGSCIVCSDVESGSRQLASRVGTFN
jgi:hypothetical protein